MYRNAAYCDNIAGRLSDWRASNNATIMKHVLTILGFYSQFIEQNVVIKNVRLRQLCLIKEPVLFVSSLFLEDFSLGHNVELCC